MAISPPIFDAGMEEVYSYVTKQIKIKNRIAKNIVIDNSVIQMLDLAQSSGRIQSNAHPLFSGAQIYSLAAEAEPPFNHF